MLEVRLEFVPEVVQRVVGPQLTELEEPLRAEDTVVLPRRRRVDQPIDVHRRLGGAGPFD